MSVNTRSQLSASSTLEEGWLPSAIADITEKDWDAALAAWCGKPRCQWYRMRSRRPAQAWGTWDLRIWVEEDRRFLIYS